MITIDGSLGEGGGQILRSSLSLSMVTGEPFTIRNIRAGRKKPGLLRQHLTSITAAKEVCGAAVEGVYIGSTALTFRPGTIRSGSYRFSIGTAGSTTLIFQTLLPALIKAAGTSTVVLEGGTHNPFAPPFDYLDKVFLPVIRTQEIVCDCELIRYGFYPAGGGTFKAVIHPAQGIQPLHLTDKGQIKNIRVDAIVSNLPVAIAEKEADTLLKGLALSKEQVHSGKVVSSGPGNIVTITVQCENGTEVFTGFGEKGVSSKSVANSCLKQVRSYLDSTAATGEHLADQLLIPLALAGSGSFTCTGPTKHTLTNVEVIKKFMHFDVHLEKVDTRCWRFSL